MKATFLFILLITSSLYSQNYIGVTQNTVSVQQTTINYSNNNVGLSMIANEIAAFRNSWENRKKREEAVAKAQSQLALIKVAYDNSRSYPETIIDGWHLVMATDNYNYCSPAKVLIEDNDIKQFVVGNWEALSRPFNLLSPIEKGKALISLDFDDNTDTLELYFINDLARPTLVDKPLGSGYVCFWSDLKKADHVKIWIQDFGYLGELSKRLLEQPACGADGTITLPTKPGIYEFKAAGRGSIDWSGTLEIKEDLCLVILLNEANRSD